MARNPKRDKAEILTRTETWPLKLTQEQERLLVLISDGLRDYYNWALEIERQQNETFKSAALLSGGSKPNVKRFFSEIGLYKPWQTVRQQDVENNLFRGTIPANWVVETFKAATGAYKSFFALIKNGDPDARTPGERPAWRFQAIPGCSAFSIKQYPVVSEGKTLFQPWVVLAPEIFGKDTLSFPIPAVYQVSKLARSVRNAKFIISRDEPNLNRPGRFWISVSYEIPKPAVLPFVPEEAVYIALGASSIGVVSPRGEKLIKLWRADKHWKPLIDTVEGFLGLHKKAAVARRRHKPKKEFRESTRPALTRGSRVWRKILASHATMNVIMARQQTQNRREVVAGLIGIREIEAAMDRLESLEERRGMLNMLQAESNAAAKLSLHDVHFVVTDYVVRSKEGKLADSDKPGRGGQLGLNWGAQNTAAIGYVERWLEAKAQEFGGTVRKHKLPREAVPQELPRGHENKLIIARALRDDFLRVSQEAAD